MQGRRIGRAGLQDELMRVESIIEANDVLVTLLYDSITNCTISEDFLAKLEDVEYSFRMPEIGSLIREFYLTDSLEIQKDEYNEVYLALSFGLEDLAAKEFKRDTEGAMPLGENLYHYLQHAYPDPNEFIRQYQGFYGLQKEGIDEKAGVSWLLNVMLTSDYYGFKMKLEDSISLHKLMKGYGEFMLARKIELIAEEELNG